MTMRPPEAPYSLSLYQFRYVYPLTGRWARARYRAELNEIAQRYVQ